MTGVCDKTLVAVLLTSVLLRPIAADGAVRVAEDEVIFTLTVPDAKEVFLVGDFNNWNPTIEKMDRINGTFEIYLFMLAGTYRYKFVVDGEWISDPDNPPAVPADGSLLVLEERAGMLALGSAEEVTEEKVVLLEPSGRYSGPFTLEDNKTSSNQALDFFFDHGSKWADARVNFKTTDDTWDLSPLTATIDFDRGYLDLKFGDRIFKAFENDTLWTSSDPFSMFGRVGVFDYNAGYERRGVSFELPLVLNLELNGLYADKIDGRLGPPLKIGADVFTGMAGADTVVYERRYTYEDADTWGFELLGDFGSVGFGYTKRENRGFNPGLLVDAFAGAGDDVSAATFTTREFFDADALWFRWRVWRTLDLTGGYGWGEADVRTQDQSGISPLTVPWLTIGQDTRPADWRARFQKSKRADGAVEYQFETSRVKVWYQWNQYAFDAMPLSANVSTPGSTAKIQHMGGQAEYGADGWSVLGGLRYLDQDYGNTPAEFDYFTPERNFWLDYLDKLTVENMVVFDLARSTQFSLLYKGNESVLPEFFGAVRERPGVILLAFGLTTNGFFKTIEHGMVRLGIEHTLPKRFYAQWDSRLAWYNKSSWQLDATYFSTYLEAGYRNSWSEISLGFGLDPNVLDPVPNVYADIGRETYLRRALFEGLTREDSALLGTRLAEQEQRLEDLRVLKLEVILFF
ncbi:MAG: glycogen-binding domain-containing protein [Candidatus Latescibacterota bacterium]|nr:MAG: glycogen-binding domain-containing protein [Candidatus Latescibacterota bacterium]